MNQGRAWQEEEMKRPEASMDVAERAGERGMA